MEQKLAQLQAKINADASIAKRLFSIESLEEVQVFLKEQGLDFTLEEVHILGEGLVKAIGKDEDSELTDEVLEDVAGGVGSPSPTRW